MLWVSWAGPSHSPIPSLLGSGVERCWRRTMLCFSEVRAAGCLQLRPGVCIDPLVPVRRKAVMGTAWKLVSRSPWHLAAGAWAALLCSPWWEWSRPRARRGPPALLGRGGGVAHRPPTLVCLSTHAVLSCGLHSPRLEAQFVSLACDPTGRQPSESLSLVQRNHGSHSVLLPE